MRSSPFVPGLQQSVKIERVSNAGVEVCGWIAPLRDVPLDLATMFRVTACEVGARDGDLFLTCSP